MRPPNGGLRDITNGARIWEQFRILGRVRCAKRVDRCEEQPVGFSNGQGLNGMKNEQRWINEQFVYSLTGIRAYHVRWLKVGLGGFRAKNFW